MWVEIILSGTITILLIAGVLKFMAYRMDKMVTKEHCNERHENIVKVLDSGSDQFKEINTKLSSIEGSVSSINPEFKMYCKMMKEMMDLKN